MADKGKGIADDYSSGKRKHDGDDKSAYRKRKNLNVLQFFEDAALENEESDSSDDDVFINDGINIKNSSDHRHRLHFCYILGLICDLFKFRVYLFVLKRVLVLMVSIWWYLMECIWLLGFHGKIILLFGGF